MKSQLGKTNFWIVLGADCSLLVAAHLLSYLIRFDGVIGPGEWKSIKQVLPLLVGFKLAVFFFFGLYRGMWRYTSLADLLNILKACGVAGLVIIGTLLLVNRFEGFSRSVFLLDTMLTFMFTAGFRVALRFYYQKFPGTSLLQNASPRKIRPRKRLLIIGAGDAAEMVTREINDNKSLPYRVVGFLDDHPTKIGQRIHGIPVLGAIDDLQESLRRTEAREIVIAIPSASQEQMSRVVDLCRESGVPFKTLPGLGELITEKVSIKSIRDVSYKDLLGRPPVRLESERIGEVLQGRAVMVTGAGGSIGSELCRQILRFRPAKLILFDASEQNLYQLEMEILHEHGFQSYVTVLGQVQDKELLERTFRHYQPAVVFHAAAYKHVPMVERNPWEGVRNNITASRQLMEKAIRHRVERFILVSTDKAVRPTSVMGATKRMTEILMQSFSSGVIPFEGVGGDAPGPPANAAHLPPQAEGRGEGGYKSTIHPKAAPTRFMAVRFGNVLGSSGSVIPLFRRQIEMGGPVTVTHPEMTRYFMSIEEASQLILQAAAMGEGGEIFILEMGTPVRILRMARDLIRLCGKEPDSEVEIKFTGLRPGEKMYEELITEGEGIVATSHEKIMVLRATAIPSAELGQILNRLENCARDHDAEGIKESLRLAIPEYTPDHSGSVLSIPGEMIMSNSPLKGECEEDKMAEA